MKEGRMVRAGKDGRFIEDLEKEPVAVGRGELGDLTDLKSKDEAGIARCGLLRRV